MAIPMGVMLGVPAALGAAQGLFAGMGERARRRRIEELLSSSSMQQRFREIMAGRQGEFAALAEGFGLRGETSALRQQAAAGRLGFSAAGIGLAEGARNLAASNVLDLRRQMSADSFREARAQQMQAIQALLNTPGFQSPIASMLAGAGSGLQAGGIAAYAQSLRGTSPGGAGDLGRAFALTGMS